MSGRRGATAVGWLLVFGGVLLGIGGGWAMSAVALAGLVAVLATAGWSRVLVGGALVVVGCSSGLLILVDSPGDGNAQRVAFVAGAVLVIVAGALVIGFGRRWPSRRERYERDRSSAGSSNDRPLDQWRALDRGEDPTLDAFGEANSAQASQPEATQSDAALRPPPQRLDE